MNLLLSKELRNWIPRRLLKHTTEIICEWLYVSDKKFTEPFFDETILNCKNFKENSHPYKIITDIAMMTEWACPDNALQPSAVIFHVSRCGSTLLSQMLGIDESHIVLSEVPFFDELLRLPHINKDIHATAVNDFLNAAVLFYSQKRSGKEKHLFIKTDSWHIHSYPQFRKLFPSVPFIFLYRNPLEVIISHQRQRGMQSVPGIIEPEVFGFSKEQIAELTLDTYMALVLKTYFIKMIEIAEKDPLVLIFNYAEGIPVIIKKIYAFLQLQFTKEIKDLFDERSSYHAKHPHQLFAEEKKETAPPPYLLPVFKLYQQLDELRALRTVNK